MSRSRSRSGRSRRPPARGRRSRSLQVPGWYYALLGLIALVGATLIVRSIQIRPADPEQGEYPLGRLDAPVTIIEWGGFQ